MNPSHKQAKPKSPTTQALAASALLFGALLLVGCSGDGDGGVQASAAAGQMPPPSVEVLEVQMQAIPRVQSLAGRTVAYKQAEVRPQTSGLIEKQLFVEGSYVAQNQSLYRIDASSYEANAANAKAALIKAKAALAAANAKLARYETLAGTDAISQQTLDDVKAQATLARADVAAARSNLESNQINLGRTTVRAPIAGQTSRTLVNQGALVAAGQTHLVTITQLDPIYVDMSQSATDMLKIRRALSSTNQSATSLGNVSLELEDGSSYPLKGKLSFSEAQVDPDSGAINVRAVFANPDHILLPGMYVTAKLTQGQLINAILLPQSAVMRTPKGNTQVYVVGAEDKIAVRPVTVNGTHEGQWIVTKGLANGARVVVKGGMKTKPEMVVAAKPFNPSVANTPEGGTSESNTPANSALKNNTKQSQTGAVKEMSNDNTTKPTT